MSRLGASATNRVAKFTSARHASHASTSDPVTLDFAVGVSPNLPFGTDLAIAGRYVVTETSTGEQFETKLTIPIFLVDSDFALGNPLEGTLRVTFES